MIVFKLSVFPIFLAFIHFSSGKRLFSGVPCHLSYSCDVNQSTLLQEYKTEIESECQYACYDQGKCQVQFTLQIQWQS